MAKRYYNSKMGMGYYEGMDERRKQERMDGSMISEDMSAIANMPQGVIMREYPTTGYAYYDVSDTLSGVDRQISSDMKEKKGKNPQKY